MVGMLWLSELEVWRDRKSQFHISENEKFWLQMEFTLKMCWFVSLRGVGRWILWPLDRAKLPVSHFFPFFYANLYLTDLMWVNDVDSFSSFWAENNKTTTTIKPLQLLHKKVSLYWRNLLRLKPSESCLELSVVQSWKMCSCNLWRWFIQITRSYNLGKCLCQS